MAKIVFTQQLRRFTEVPEIDTAAATLRAALEAAFAVNPRLRGYVLDEQGHLRHHVVIFIDGHRVRDHVALNDALAPVVGEINAVCGNGSQYKFWYYDSPTSNNMVVMFEGGGACWDYDTCSGRAGVLGASNPNGLPDNYITGMMHVRFADHQWGRPRAPLPFQARHRNQRLGHGLHAVLHRRRAHGEQHRDLR